MIVKFLLRILAIAIIGGCTTFASSIQESKTDSILSHYVADLKYEESRRAVAKHIAHEIERSYVWHEKKDPMIQMDRALSGARQVELFGHPDDIKQVRDAFSRAFKISTRFPEEQDQTHIKGGPVEFSAMREIYVLTPDSRVSIWNSGDRTRLYHRELELYERVYPERAKTLKATILRDHPNIEFHPWGE